jgi:hypothetical protein
MEAQQPKKPRLTSAERRAKAALAISPAQLRYSTLQAQVLLAMGNTSFWKEVGMGRLQLYSDGNKRYVTRSELERYERERQEAANRAKHTPRAQPGRKGLAISPLDQPICPRGGLSSRNSQPTKREQHLLK